MMFFQRLALFLVMAMCAYEGSACSSQRDVELTYRASDNGNPFLESFLREFTNHCLDFSRDREPFHYEFELLDYQVGSKAFYGYHLLYLENNYIRNRWLLLEGNTYARFAGQFKKLQEFLELSTQSNSKEMKLSQCKLSERFGFEDESKLFQCSLLEYYFENKSKNWFYKGTLVKFFKIENAGNIFMDAHIIMNHDSKEIVILAENSLNGC